MYMCSYDVCFKLLCILLRLNFRFLLSPAPSCHVALRLILSYQRQFLIIVVKSSSPLAHTLCYKITHFFRFFLVLTCRSGLRFVSRARSSRTIASKTDTMFLSSRCG